MQLKAQAVLSLSKYLELAASRKTKAAEEFLLGNDPRIEKERKHILKLLRGFHLDVNPFSQISPDIFPDLTICRLTGQHQKQAILSRLRKGIPVALGMDLAGLAEWGKGSSKNSAWHAFVVSGFETKGPKGDQLILKTRNSWDGKNPDVTEDRLCRVHSVIALLTDTEK